MDRSIPSSDTPENPGKVNFALPYRSVPMGSVGSNPEGAAAQGGIIGKSAIVARASLGCWT
jgi:hypothetical protein